MKEKCKNLDLDLIILKGMAKWNRLALIWKEIKTRYPNITPKYFENDNGRLSPNQIEFGNYDYHITININNNATFNWKVSRHNLCQTCRKNYTSENIEEENQTDLSDKFWNSLRDILDSINLVRK